MATIEMNALFPATAHVKLYERCAAEPFAAGGDVVAWGVVEQDSTLRLTGLDAGSYWAVVDGGYPVAVTAKESGRVSKDTEDRRTKRRPTGDGDVIGDDGELVASLDDDTPVQGRDAADTLVEGDPKAEEAPVRSTVHEVVTGPRTSANTRVQADASKPPEKSLTQTVKEAVKGKGKS